MSIRQLFTLLLLVASLITSALATHAQAADDELQESYAYGTVESLDETTLVISGIPFNITEAVIEADDAARLAVGVWVEVEFLLDTDGAVWATSVSVEDEPTDGGDEEDSTESFVLAGVLESYEGTTMVVGGITVDVSAATIHDDDLVVVGSFVYVVFDDVDGVMVAVAVHHTDDLDDVEDELDGDDADDEDDEDDEDGCAIPTGWYEYEVRNGDTLSGIAAAAGTTLEALMSANCITNASIIRVGDDIYTPVKISSGGGDDDDDDDDDSDDDNDDNDDSDDGDDDNDDNDDSDDGDDDDDDDDDNDDDDDDGDDD